MKHFLTLYLVRKNIRRHLFRYLILAVSVAVVVGLQVSALLIDLASQQSLGLGLKRLGADLVAVPRGLSQELARAYLTGEAAVFYMDKSIQDRISRFDFVSKTSSQLFIKSLSNAGCCSLRNIYLIGFEPETDFIIKPWLKTGSFDQILGDEVLAGAALGLEPGNTLKFYGHSFHVAGVLSPTGMGLDRAVFIPLSSAYQMAEESGIKAEQTLQISPSQISAVLIKLKPENQGGLPASRAAFELEQKIPELSILQPGDLSNKLGQNLSMVLRDLSSASYAIWTATALLIALVFAMATNERKREIGILRSLGATRWFIFRMIIIEGILIGLSGSILGLIVSTGLILGFSSLISQSLAIPFFQPQASQLIPVFLIALCLALLTGSVAALYPALRVSQLEPYQAIRSGE